MHENSITPPPEAITTKKYLYFDDEIIFPTRRYLKGGMNIIRDIIESYLRELYNAVMNTTTAKNIYVFTWYNYQKIQYLITP